MGFAVTRWDKDVERSGESVFLMNEVWSKNICGSKIFSSVPQEEMLKAQPDYGMITAKIGSMTQLADFISPNDEIRAKAKRELSSKVMKHKLGVGAPAVPAGGAAPAVVVPAVKGGGGGGKGVVAPGVGAAAGGAVKGGGVVPGDVVAPAAGGKVGPAAGGKGAGVKGL